MCLLQLNLSFNFTGEIVDKFLTLLWEAATLIFFLITFHLMNVFTFALNTHFEITERVEMDRMLKIRKYQKQNLRNFYVLLQENHGSILTGSSTSKLIESLRL